MLVGVNICERSTTFFDHLNRISAACNFPKTLPVRPGDPKKLHGVDRTYFLESKCYEDKQGISM